MEVLQYGAIPQFSPGGWLRTRAAADDAGCTLGIIAVLVGFAHSTEAALGPTAGNVAAGTPALAALGGTADVVVVDARDAAGARDDCDF